MARISDDKVRCSFCGKTGDQVRKMISGPSGTYICDECVELCAELIEEEFEHDEAQEEEVREQINLLKPKEIKAVLDDYVIGQEEAKREICGRNMALGLPALLEITADFVANAIAENLKSIVDAIKVILERTPPELGVDIIRNGIFLTGGVANLKGLDKLIADATNIKVNLVEKPEECVARGLERVIKEKEFKSLTFVTKEQNYN